MDGSIKKRPGTVSFFWEFEYEVLFSRLSLLIYVPGWFSKDSFGFQAIYVSTPNTTK